VACTSDAEVLEEVLVALDLQHRSCWCVHRPLSTNKILGSTIMSPTAVSPLNLSLSSMIPSNQRENAERIALSTLRPDPPRSSLSAILVFLQQQVQGLDPSQVGPDHFVRVASEDVYSWIEQLNPTVNVLRAFSATVGDPGMLRK
jgi:hypothetical protein